MGDSRPGLYLARAQTLYVDKFLLSPCGVVALQYLENARYDFTSGLTKPTVNPADKQDVEEAMALVSERARCSIFKQTRNLAIVVYTFVSRTLYDSSSGFKAAVHKAKSNNVWYVGRDMPWLENVDLMSSRL